MTKKRSLTLALVLLAAGLLAFVGAGATTAATGSKSSTFKVCLVTDIGGLNDKSFNHLAFVGLTRAKTQLKAQILVEQSKSAADYIPNLSTCARKGYSLTIGVGFLMADAMDTVASKLPEEQVRDRGRGCAEHEAQAEECSGSALQGAGGRLRGRLPGRSLGQGPSVRR